MKYIFLAITLTFVSCIPVKNELWIHQDNSGRFVQTYDLGEIANQIRGMMPEDDQSMEDEIVINFLKEVLPPDLIRDTMNLGTLYQARNEYANGADLEFLERFQIIEIYNPSEMGMLMEVSLAVQQMTELNSIGKKLNEIATKLDPDFMEGLVLDIFPDFNCNTDSRTIEMGLPSPEGMILEVMNIYKKQILYAPDSLKEGDHRFDTMYDLYNREIHFAFHTPNRVKKVSPKSLLNDQKELDFIFKPFNNDLQDTIVRFRY